MTSVGCYVLFDVCRVLFVVVCLLFGVCVGCGLLLVGECSSLVVVRCVVCCLLLFVVCRSLFDDCCLLVRVVR